MKTEIIKKIKLNYEIMLWLYFVIYAVTLGMYNVNDYEKDYKYHFFSEDKMNLAVWIGIGTVIVLILYRGMYELKSRNNIALEIITNLFHCICTGIAISKIAYIKRLWDAHFNIYPNIVMILGIIILVMVILLGIVNVVLYTKGLNSFEYPINSEKIDRNYSIEYTRGKIEGAFTAGIIVFTFIFMISAAIGEVSFSDEPDYLQPDHAFIKVLLSSMLPLLVFFFGIAKEWISIGSTKKMIISALVLTFSIYNIWFNTTRGYHLLTGELHNWDQLIREFPIGAPFVAYFAIVAIFAVISEIRGAHEN